MELKSKLCVDIFIPQHLCIPGAGCPITLALLVQMSQKSLSEKSKVTDNDEVMRCDGPFSLKVSELSGGRSEGMGWLHICNRCFTSENIILCAHLWFNFRPLLFQFWAVLGLLLWWLVGVALALFWGFFDVAQMPEAKIECFILSFYA